MLKPCLSSPFRQSLIKETFCRKLSQKTIGHNAEITAPENSSHHGCTDSTTERKGPRTLEKRGQKNFKSQRTRDSSVKYCLLEITGNLTHDTSTLWLWSALLFSVRVMKPTSSSEYGRPVNCRPPFFLFV